MSSDDIVYASNNLSERATRAQLTPDAMVPWWAIELLDLSNEDGNLNRVRMILRKGYRAPKYAATFWDCFGQLIDMAKQRVMTRTLDEWVDLCWAQTDHETGEVSELGQVIRDAALFNSRSFISFLGLADDEGHPIVLKDFHVQTIRAMRSSKVPSCILIPFEHGKSYLGSIPVPLMDWAEWNNASQGRVYWNDKLMRKWIRRLMQEVEINERLHKLFPWVRKPRKGDAGWGIWSTKGFSIGGRTLADSAFEPLTANAFSTGNRYSRIGADDWVNTKNATSPVQDDLWDYLKTGPMTFQQKLTRQSKYDTAWPSFYLCGTLFDRNDINYRAFQEYKMLGYKSLRFDVYTKDGGVIWPEYRDKEFVDELKRSLGVRVFNMRCRNMVGGLSSSVFPETIVRRAEHDGKNGKMPYDWTVVPKDTRVIIGFDPGSGKLNSASKNPAFVVYGIRDANPQNNNPAMLRDPMSPPPAEDLYHHVIQCGRLEGYGFTRQCDKLVQLARFYNCPVAVEDNATQVAYADYIRARFPDITVITHTTTENKRDPNDGVEQFEPLFHNERVIIHAHNAPPQDIAALRSELVNWSTNARARWRYTDVVMALWIAAYQMKLRHAYDRPLQVIRQVPEYMRRFASRRSVPY